MTPNETRVPLASEADIVTARQKGRSLAVEVEVGQRGAIPVGLAERVVRRQGHSSRRRWHAGEPAGRRLAGGENVEPCQPERHRDHVDVTQDPGESPGVGEIEEVHQQGGCNPEGDDVHQRIQFGAEPGAGSREARHPAVEHIEDAGEHDEPARPTEVSVEGRDDGPEPKEEVAERKGTRHDYDHLAYGRAPQPFAVLPQHHFATGVTPT